EREPDAAVPALYKQDPYKVLEDIVDRWIAADEADRRERGLSLRIHDEEAQQRRIDDLELELVRLRGAQPHALPAPESDRGVIDPPTGDIVPPGEQSDRNLYRGNVRPAPADPKPPVTIEAKAKPLGSSTGPADGCPPWLRQPAPVAPNKRPPATPVVAKSGAETEAQRQRVNADRSVEHKVIGSARMVQPDNLSSGFFWGGASGKRAW